MLNEISKFADYGLLGVLLVVLGLGSGMFKYFMDYIKKSDERHIAMYESVMEIVKSNTEVLNATKATAEQTQKYIELRNGSFEKFMNKIDNKLDACPSNNKRR